MDDRYSVFLFVGIVFLAVSFSAYAYVDGSSAVSSDSMLRNCSSGEEIHIRDSIINHSTVDCANITDSDLLYSSVYNASRNITDATLRFASISGNVLTSGQFIYDGRSYYGPFNIDDIYAGVLPTGLGTITTDPTTARLDADVVFTYSSGKIGYTVTVDTSNVSSAGIVSLYDDGQGNDEVAGDGVYTSGNVSVTTGSGAEMYTADIDDGVGNRWTISKSVYIDTIPPTGSIYISDVDENSDSETTDSRVVTLHLTADDDVGVDKCRVANNGTNISTVSFTTCQETLPWVIEAENGEKMVVYQIRDVAGNVATYNDTIELSMAFIEGPQVDDYGDYSGYTDKVHFRIYHEGAVKTAGVTYDYRIYNETDCSGPADKDPESSACNITAWTNTEYTDVWHTNLSLIAGVNYTIGVRSYSGGISDQEYSDGFQLDVTPPVISSVAASVSNETWTSDPFINLNISASDPQSDISGFSYRIGTSDREPDDAVDVIGDNVSIYFSDLGQGIYYMNIRAKSGGHIFSDTYSYVFYVDTSRPPIPYVENDSSVGQGLHEFSWTSVTDVSGIDGYEVEIATDPYFDNIVDTDTTNATSYEFTAEKGAIYYMRVRALNGAGLYSLFSDKYDADIDTQAPRFLLSKPSGTVIRTKPLLYVETDEKANCFYQQGSGEQKKMDFTGGQFHEQLVSLDDGTDYTYMISCYDEGGIQNTTTLSFSVDTSRTPSSISTTQESFSLFTSTMSTFDVNVRSSSTGIGELALSDFTVELADKEIEEYSINDRGDGVYRVSFMSPSSEGTYALEVCYKTLCTIDAQVVVRELPFTVSIDLGSSPAISELSRLSYASISNYTIGLASDTSSSLFNNSAASGRLEIRSLFEEDSGRNYIFFTDSVAESTLESKNQRLERRQFFEDNNPSFSNSVSKFIDLSIALDYGNIVFDGTDVSSRGDHSVLIKNEGLTSDKKLNLSLTIT